MSPASSTRASTATNNESLQQPTLGTQAAPASTSGSPPSVATGDLTRHEEVPNDASPQSAFPATFASAFDLPDAHFLDQESHPSGANRTGRAGHNRHSFETQIQSSSLGELLGAGILFDPGVAFLLSAAKAREEIESTRTSARAEIETLQKELQSKDKELQSKDKELQSKEKDLQSNRKEIEELKRKLEDTPGKGWRVRARLDSFLGRAKKEQQKASGADNAAAGDNGPIDGSGNPSGPSGQRMLEQQENKQ